MANPASFFACEELKGYITIGAADFEPEFQQGHRDNTYVLLKLKLAADDIHRFASEPEHSTSLGGTVACDALGGTLPVEGGTFNLFKDTANPARKRMLYRIFFTGSQGPLTLSGFKVISDDPRFSVWSNCQSLYTKIFPGRIETEEQEATADIFAAGLVFLHWRDFWKIDFLTFRIRGPLFARIRGFFQFASFFLGTLQRFRKIKLQGRR